MDGELIELAHALATSLTRGGDEESVRVECYRETHRHDGALVWVARVVDGGDGVVVERDDAAFIAESDAGAAGALRLLVSTLAGLLAARHEHDARLLSSAREAVMP
jgi:hypothetical protein